MWWLRFVKADKASYICSQIQWKMKLIANSPFFFNHWSNLFYLQTPYELHLNDVRLWDMLILHLFFNLTNDGWLLLKREILVCRWYYLLPWESRSEVINLFFFLFICDLPFPSVCNIIPCELLFSVIFCRALQSALATSKNSREAGWILLVIF